MPADCSLQQIDSSLPVKMLSKLADRGLPSDPSLGHAWRVSCWLSSLRLEVRTWGAFGRSVERVMWGVLTCFKGNKWGTMEVSLGSTLWWCYVLHGWTNQPFSSFYFIVFTCSYHYMFNYRRIVLTMRHTQWDKTIQEERYGFVHEWEMGPNYMANKNRKILPYGKLT